MADGDDAVISAANNLTATLKEYKDRLSTACLGAMRRQIESQLAAYLRIAWSTGVQGVVEVSLWRVIHQIVPQLSLTITGITAADKAADGNTTATLDTGSAALSGVQTNHVVTLDVASAVGTFSSADAGARTVAITGCTISGADAWRYDLAQPSTTATIT